jgi:pyruvate dehydrogenase E2 component (dihydrolipoamide acetyltransferase)/2-oxoglutarate dehydrogenase E2 component (dihydrolipoamide succinyltransferase)
MAYEIIMPALGMNQDTGIVVTWHKQLGESVKAHEVLFEVETDKTTMEVEAGYDGILAQIMAKVGEPIPLGQVIALVAMTSEEAADIASKAQ